MKIRFNIFRCFFQVFEKILLYIWKVRVNYILKINKEQIRYYKAFCGTLHFSSIIAAIYTVPRFVDNFINDIQYTLVYYSIGYV